MGADLMSCNKKITVKNGIVMEIIITSSYVSVYAIAINHNVANGLNSQHAKINVIKI
ncbi:hypothetical protein H477_2591 [[Clostridium] sordellii ATCC 9714]|nr:hypothetical protein H477_2591 [[Clostridium] sordellii ATCC 9714] [Paeniclostridium sordellii ATCC 9714]